MNERLLELAKQATVSEPYYPAGNDGHPEYRIYVSQEKFAELIVGECIKTLADNGEFRGCVIIVKHFKVEE